MLKFLKIIIFFISGIIFTVSASAHHEDSLVPSEGKISCATIKCHIKRNKEHRADYFTDEIYNTEHTFWGCAHTDDGEHVWTVAGCIADCSLILDIPTCSESCAFIAHDIDSMNIDIGERVCN